MHPPRPRRLPGCSYVGYQSYFLTISARRPARPFLSSGTVGYALAQLRQCLSDEEIAILAYSFMPDHVHLVLEGSAEDADLRRGVARWKQMVGYWYARQMGERLWMTGYHDHVLRGPDSVMDFVLYVMANPVKAGLARKLGEHPFTGSDVYGNQELQEMFEQA